MNQTLKVFIDNLFIGIKSNDQIIKIKEELYMSSQEKYEDLLNEGLSENEAIGKIISEFGDLKEILSELDMDGSDDKIENKVELAVLTKGEFNKKYKLTKMCAMFIALATFWILTIVGVVATISQLKEFSMKDMTTTLILILGIIPSIAMYIYAGIKLDAEKKKNHARYELDHHVKELVETEYESNKNKFIVAIITGVVLCLLGIGSFILGSGNIENLFNTPSIFYLIGFILIGSGVVLFIYFGTLKEFFGQITNEKELEDKETLADKISGAIFIVATIIYLISGFIFKAWGYMWVVYPISALIVAIIHIFFGEKKEK